MKRILTVLALALSSVVTSAATPDEAPIRTLLNQMTEAWNRGDAAAVAAVFTQEGSMIAGDGTQLSGPADIARYLAQLMEKMPKGTRFSSTVTEVTFPAADLAVLMSEGGFLRPDEVTVAPERQGIQSIVARRDRGTWRVVLFQRTRRLPGR